MSTDSIFTKIINKEIPAKIEYEDDQFIAIYDIHPAAPIHLLIIPKQEISSLEKVPLDNESFHSQLLLTARKVAKQAGIADNYKLMMNVGPQVQAVPHIHLHLLGGWNQDKSTEELDKESETFTSAVTNRKK